MSYVILHADKLRSVASDDALVSATEVEALRDAMALLSEAGRLRDDAEQDIAAARTQARAAGEDEGRADGRALVQAATTETLAKLHDTAAAVETERRADIARLALEVVRRIAGDIGSPSVVAGLVERATLSLTSDAGAVVRVAAPCVEAVRERLAAREGVTVEADPTLDATDCVIETPLGSTHAGLETQLSALARAWNLA